MVEGNRPTEPHDGEPRPSVKQLVHWATGDREAEAETLAEQTGVAPDDALAAVQRAHGDVTSPDPEAEPDSTIAGPADAERARADHDRERNPAEVSIELIRSQQRQLEELARVIEGTEEQHETYTGLRHQMSAMILDQVHDIHRWRERADVDADADDRAVEQELMHVADVLRAGPLKPNELTDVVAQAGALFGETR
jgi:hypothetical protein